MTIIKDYQYDSCGRVKCLKNRKVRNLAEIPHLILK